VTTKIWLQSYQEGVPAEINPDAYSSIVDIFLRSCNKFKDKIAYTNLGSQLTYQDLAKKCRDFAAYCQQTLKLTKGTRLAIMLPNSLQYPIAMFGALQAGLTVVNVNPLYTARELTHQLKDCGATAIVVMENFAHVLQEALPATDIKHIFVTQLGDMFHFP
jgi:long-chain acyl-CoA synthetase